MQRSMSLVSVRTFSTKIQRTPEQIKEGIEKVQRFRKHVFNTRKYIIRVQFIIKLIWHLIVKFV